MSPHPFVLSLSKGAGTAVERAPFDYALRAPLRTNDEERAA